MFQRILVPLDGSLRAEQALPVAAHIAQATGGSILLTQVVSPPLDLRTPRPPIPLVREQIIESELAAASTYLQSIVDSSVLSGIETRMEISSGFPVQHLCSLVKAYKIDLLVLCSHGRTGFTRWVLGSVARSLVHQCTIPLLVLNQRDAPSALSPLSLAPGPIRTLIPLDGSPLAEAALRPAAYLTAALAEAGQGVLHLARVVNIFPTEVGYERNVEALQQATTYLGQVEENMRAEMQDLRLSFEYSVEQAPETTLALVNLAEHGKKGKGEQIAEINPCNLIAIATHGRGGPGRWVMGSVTERLLNTTTLPILLVRSPNAG